MANDPFETKTVSRVGIPSGFTNITLSDTVDLKYVLMGLRANAAGQVKVQGVKGEASVFVLMQGDELVGRIKRVFTTDTTIAADALVGFIP